MSSEVIPLDMHDTRLTFGPKKSLTPLYILSCPKNTLFQQTPEVTLLSSRKQHNFRVCYLLPTEGFKATETSGILEVEVVKNNILLYTLNTRKIPSRDDMKTPYKVRK